MIYVVVYVGCTVHVVFMFIQASFMFVMKLCNLVMMLRHWWLFSGGGKPVIWHSSKGPGQKKDDENEEGKQPTYFDPVRAWSGYILTSKGQSIYSSWPTSTSSSLSTTRCVPSRPRSTSGPSTSNQARWPVASYPRILMRVRSRLNNNVVSDYTQS